MLVSDRWWYDAGCSAETEASVRTGQCRSSPTGNETTDIKSEAAINSDNHEDILLDVVVQKERNGRRRR